MTQNSTAKYLPKEIKTRSQKDLYKHVHSSFIYESQKPETLSISKKTE